MLHAIALATAGIRITVITPIADLKVQFHDDGWYFHRSWDHDRDHRWHDWHDGRGYWRNGVWITF